MLNRSKHKAGYTLIEVMAVVTILGILSGMGVAGLRSAIANARIKDAAYNVTAYMERTANEARRMNAVLCVIREDDQTLATYKGACDDATGDGNGGLEKIDELKLDSPNQILQDNEVTASTILGGTNLVTAGAEFSPRLGLSAAPSEGFIAIQYGSRGLYGAAAKVKSKNAFVPMMKFDEGSWFGI